MYFVIGCLCYISVTCYGDFIDDYCWRDYFGITPTDALKAGHDKNGNPIYIGQVLHDNKLIPGEIYENSTEIHIEFHDAHVLKNAIKMLCTRHPEIFQWVKTQHDNVLDKRNKYKLFEGGYERGYITYVGRAVSHGELTVGKVICHGYGCYKLTTVENGKWYEHDVFEILTYNTNAKVKRTTVTSTAASTTSSRAPTFFTDVYRRQPLPTIVYTTKINNVSEFSLSTINYASTILNQQTGFTANPTPVAYSSGVYETISRYLCVLLQLMYLYQV